MAEGCGLNVTSEHNFQWPRNIIGLGVGLRLGWVRLLPHVPKESMSVIVTSGIGSSSNPEPFRVLNGNINTLN